MYETGDFIYDRIYEVYGVIISQDKQTPSEDIVYKYAIVDKFTREITNTTNSNSECYLINGRTELASRMEELMQEYDRVAKLHKKFYIKQFYVSELTLDKTK